MKKIFLSMGAALFMCIASAQVSKTIDVATAGSFRSVFIAAGGNKSTTTNLTVTGNIDARDVKFMRYSMPVLSVLDLAAVQIKAYNGTGGTSATSTDYPANTIPEESFKCYDVHLGKVNLNSIKLPNSIIAIGNSAFYLCDSLSGTLIIPKSVTSIGDNAFFCTGFTGTLTISNSVTSIGNNAFNGCKGFTGSLTIPNSVTSLGTWAFDGCLGFTDKLKVSDGITIIPDYAFQGCMFTSLVLPNSLKTLGIETFADCFNFAGDLILPNSLTSLVGFRGCYGFTGCYIPKSVNDINMFAFNGCNGLKKVVVNKTTPLTINNLTFDGVDKNSCELIVPMGSKAAYQVADVWKDFTNITEAIFVTLNTQGGYTAKPITTTLANSTITAPDIPVRDGYSFVGWYKEAACTNAWDFATDIVTAPVTLYAKWTQVLVSIVDHQFPGIRLYPNPATTTLNLGNLKQNAQISIFSMDGKLMKQQNITTSESAIDIEDFPKGVYLLKVNNKEINMVQKFIKQ